jgi:NCS1 family nucleobase:cation symporter-1
MSDVGTQAVGEQEIRRLGVETTGIEIIDEADRTARPADLFWPWFAANVSVFGISYAGFIFGFGISFWQAVVVAAVGIVVSFLLCGIIAIAGKRGSAPTMILSRSAFGVTGQKVPGVISWLTSIGWETFLAILATLATATIFRQLGWGGGTATKIVACLVTAVLIVAASVAGYHIIMRMQSWLTWITGVVTIVYVGLTLKDIHWSAVSALPSGSTQAVIGALVLVMTGFGLGWINIAADWSRYQRRDASDGSIVFWNTFGGALAPVLLVIYGLALAGSDKKLRDGIAADPVGTLATILPTWFLVPFLVAAILALVSGAVLGIYSSGLTLLSLGVRIRRPSAAFIDGVILTLGTIYVVFFAESFLAPFQSFLITLGVPLASWAGIMIADIMLRRHDYDEDALFNARGRYGSWDWTSIATVVVASAIGWGLVINLFAADASWNNWQGYLLEPLGLGGKDGAWAYANLGVIIALLLSFLVTYVLRRGTVRRQERGHEQAYAGEAGAR